MDRKFNKCVFCRSPKLNEKFSRLILNKYETKYHECQQCGSLQISEVYWLEEAYGDLPFDLDTWVAQRCLRNVFFVKALRASGMLPEKGKVLDFGAGSGLLVRFLRDEGFDAFGYDKYSETPFCKNFSFKNVVSIADKKFDLIIALEVTEHLLQPQETLKQLASLLSKKGIIFLSTTCYEKNIHDENWDYLISQGGQHINFASKKGLRILANSQNLSTMFMPHEISLFCGDKSQASKLNYCKAVFFYRMYIVIAKLLGLLNFKNCENDNQLIYETIVKDYK